MNKTSIFLATAIVCAATDPAAAYRFEQSGADVQVDTTLSMGAAWRVQSQDPRYIGIDNGGSAYSTNEDDGDLAFKPGQVVSSALKGLTDITVSKGDFGLFVRGRYVFNDRLHNYDFFNADNYYTPPAGGPDPGVGIAPSGNPSEVPYSVYAQRTSDVRNAVGSYADLLDGYVFGDLPFIGNRELTFKLGRQVMNWGESTLVLNGINSLLAFDANQQHVPGTEFPELLRPQSMLWLSTNVVEGVSIEGFYQLEWRPTRVNASGTFWSTNDFAGPGGQRANITFGLTPENYPGSTIPRAKARTPGNDGQYGGKLTMFVPALNDMELAFYAMKYSSRLPVVSGISGTAGTIPAPSTTGSYFLEYPSDIQLYGVSFNSTLGEWSVQGEYSYKVDQPLQIDDVELLLAGVGLPSQLTPPTGSYGQGLGNKYIRGWRRHDISQADFGTTYVFPPSTLTGWDELLFIGEVAGDYVHDLPPQSVLRYDGPGTFTPADPTVAALATGSLGQTVPVQQGGYATAFSWGYRMLARATYNGVLGVFRMQPSLQWSHDVQGVTPGPLTNFVKGRKDVTAKLSVNYLQAWTYELGYTGYFGGVTNQLGDRDFVEMVVKYAF